MTNDDAKRKAVRLRIHGRVQGVFFRAWVEQEAQELGLCGWVRNRRDGSVEALFSGPPEAVDEMIARCRQGPDAARVEDVGITAAEGLCPARFEIRPTV